LKNMATLYATLAEEKNSLLQAILSRNQKQITQSLLHATHINRNDRNEPLTAIINVTKLVLKLLQDGNHQKKKISKTDAIINKLKSKHEVELYELNAKYENELHALHRQLKKTKNESEALEQKLKTFELLKEANDNIRLTNKLNRFNAEREDEVHDLGNNIKATNKILPKISSSLVDEFDRTRAIESIEEKLRLEKAHRMRAENAVFQLTTSNDKRLHIMYTGKNDVVDKMYKLEQERQKAVDIAHDLRKDLKLQIERSKRLKRLCEVCMSDKESLEKQLEYSKNEINHLLNDKIKLKTQFKDEIVKEQLRSEIVKAKYIGKINAEQAFRQNLIGAHEKHLSMSFEKTLWGQTIKTTKRRSDILDAVKDEYT
jgi:hypothetical protein